MCIYIYIVCTCICICICMYCRYIYILSCPQHVYFTRIFPYIPLSVFVYDIHVSYLHWNHRLSMSIIQLCCQDLSSHTTHRYGAGLGRSWREMAWIKGRIHGSLRGWDLTTWKRVGFFINNGDQPTNIWLWLDCITLILIYGWVPTKSGELLRSLWYLIWIEPIKNRIFAAKIRM